MLDLRSILITVALLAAPATPLEARATGAPTTYYKVQTTSEPSDDYLIGKGLFTEAGRTSTCKLPS